MLRKYGVGEANTLLYILTRDHGLLRAQARSTRVAASKLRYGLEPLTFARYCLVKGKYEWRLVGVEDISRAAVPGSAVRSRALGRVGQLLMRLVQGQDPQPKLYAAVADGFHSLARASDADADSIECMLVLRILSHLGYLPQVPELTPFVEGDFYSIELAAQAARSRALLVRTINESLQATGL